MIWNDYHNLYLRYGQNIYRNKVFGQISRNVFNDFPNKVPYRMKRRINKDILRIYKMILHSLTDDQKLSSSTDNLYTIDNETSSVSGDMFMMMTLNILLNRNTLDIDFIDFILEQELVMIFTQIDAFLGDTIRVICRNNINIMKSKTKQISWETVIGSYQSNDIITNLIEEYVYSYGWKNIKGASKSLSEQPFNLNLKSIDKDIEYLADAELIRHLFVHSGGRVTRDYLIRSNNSDLKIGEKISISQNDINKIADSAHVFMGCIFSQVSEKFFNINYPNDDNGGFLTGDTSYSLDTIVINKIFYDSNDTVTDHEDNSGPVT